MGECYFKLKPTILLKVMPQHECFGTKSRKASHMGQNIQEWTE